MIELQELTFIVKNVLILKCLLLYLGAVHNCQHLCIRTECTNSQTPPTQICTFKC